MAFRTVRVFVHNETASTLTLTRADLDSGAWGADGRQIPPSTIAAGQVVMMRSESSGLLPEGTEAHVTYRIGEDPGHHIAVHWGNPVVGSVKYHQSTDNQHFAFRVGGGGNDAVVHYYLREAGLRTTGFLPSQDGFQFANWWPSTPYSLPPLRGTALDLKYGNAANGLCGGMVFAACDYFTAGMSIPGDVEAPPGEQSPLFLYLVERLFATFAGLNVSLMLKLMNPAYPDTDENVLGALGLASGRASVIAHQEWPLIRSDIDAGRPSPVALITVKSTLPWDLGKCHQVLAYAYEAFGNDVVLHVYDPNQPRRDDVRMRFSTRTVAERIVVEHNVDVPDDDGRSRRPVYCLARLAFTPATPTVPTAPRPRGPAHVIPRQVSLEVTGTEVLDSVEIGRGRKNFDVLMCGEQEFDFVRVAQKRRMTVVAHAVGYADPVIAWRLSDVDVPAGADHVVRPRPYELSDSGTFDHLTAAGGDPRVTIATTTASRTLVFENVAGDGQYGLTARAMVTERDGSHAKQASIDCSVIGVKDIVPGLQEAQDRCFHEWLDSLRQEGPTEEAIIAALYAQLGRPDDPLWDPDPLQLTSSWQDGLTDPDHEMFVDPATVLGPEEQLVVELTDSDQLVVVDEGTEVVTVDMGPDAMLAGSVNGNVVIVNRRATELVIVDHATHEALAVVPAHQDLTVTGLTR